jgi:hypothetical protein
MTAGPDRETDAWVEGLAGRSADDREAQVLREAILAHGREQEQQAAPPEASDDAAWQRMRFRLRREGLVTGGRPAWRTWVPASAVAALVLALAVPAFIGRGADDYPFSTDEPPTMRGGPAVQEFSVADPLRSARKVAGIVSRQDPATRVYHHGGNATVDFELSPSAVTALNQELLREVPQSNVQPGYQRWVFRPAR